MSQQVGAQQAGAQQAGQRPAAQVPAADSRAGYLAELLTVLWPPPATVSRPGRLARAAAGGTEFIAFPSGKRPVLLLPRRPRRAAAGALRNYKASAQAADRLAVRAVALAAGAGLADLLPGRIRIEPGTAGPDADIASYLRTALQADASFSLYVGPARANRKPVLQALAPDGRVLGFVKVGITPFTRDLVRAEAAALDFLAGRSLARVQPPRLLHHGKWRGTEVLVQQALSGSRQAGGDAVLSGAMAEVAGVRGVERMPAAQSPYWQRLRSALEALASAGAASHQRESAAALLRALGQLDGAARTTALSFGSWHGDWTPWNMTMAADRALVWDWERFETGVPVGYDALHHKLHGAVIRGSADAAAAAYAAAAGAAQTLAPLGVGQADEAGLVAALYLAEISARYLRDGQAEAGVALGRVDTWLVPALGRHAAALAAR